MTAIFASSAWQPPVPIAVTPYKSRLSAYGFFEDLPGQVPAAGVLPYKLNTPLFSDYAKKLRFVKLPPGTAATYNDSAVFAFPVGTTIIKTFYYPVDFRKPHKGRRLMETRLLIHEASGWTALPYIWNESQTDATLEVAGGIYDVSWVHLDGKKKKVQYMVPNKNQCKGCHAQGKKLTPIGPAARHLNGELDYPKTGLQNQLLHWKNNGLLQGLPSDLANVPKNAVFGDESTASLDHRARSWLDINCGHCHNKYGPANTSGLFLDIHEKDLTRLGVNKPPIAAGRGSGNRDYDIVPGKPKSSILIYRMESDDPGIRMPEIGRSIAHKEGLALVSEWIKSM